MQRVATYQSVSKARKKLCRVNHYESHQWTDNKTQIVRCKKTTTHDQGRLPQICINIHPDAVPPIHAESYHVATDKGPLQVSVYF